MSLQNGILGIFLGFVTGVTWLVLALVGHITTFLGLLSLGETISNILNILIALIGFLAFLYFGYHLFKKAWGYTK